MCSSYLTVWGRQILYSMMIDDDSDDDDSVSD